MLLSRATGRRVKHALVVGSGAGGATVAKELQGAFEVTILEAGGEFRPFEMSLEAMQRIRNLGLLRDERQISWFTPNMRTRRASDGLILVTGVGLGGTTTVATGNGMRFDADLRGLGIDLEPEFAEAYREIPIGTAHQRRWRASTRALFETCETMGLAPMPMPKMGDAERCIRCGRCVLGCQREAKWDSRRFIRIAAAQGARALCGWRVEHVVIEDGRARGVVARRRWRRQFYPADLVVLAAGGLGTPSILQASGINCEPRLFVDPVLCVAAQSPGARQCREISMPFVVQRDDFIISPYFDYLSFVFNPAWRYPADDILPLMIKLADSERGSVCNGRVDKRLTSHDREKLGEGIRLCREILRKCGAREDEVFLGTLNAGHPGGMLPLTSESAVSFHDARLPANLYVADASLFPGSLGNPPILTIVAMAKRVSRKCLAQAD